MKGTNSRTSFCALCNLSILEHIFCVQKLLGGDNIFNLQAFQLFMLSLIYMLPEFLLLVLFILSVGESDDLNSLLSISKNHAGNSFHKWEHYIAEYDERLSKFRNKNVSLLEVGVQNGGSLQLWKKYFGNSALIHGIDIDINVCKMDLGDGIHTFCFDITNETAWADHSRSYSYDIIIDDGSHLNPDVINFFKRAFPLVKPGGWFIVEDVLTSYWTTFGGGYQNPNSMIEFFKSLVEIVNFFNYARDEHLTLNSFERLAINYVKGVTFIDAMIFIEKLKYPRQTASRRVIGGILAPVEQDVFRVEMEHHGNENLLSLEEYEIVN